MKVTFKHLGHNLASSRYRAIIPGQQLRDRGVEEGKDWLVIGKHGWEWERETEGFTRVCFDVCDDHFGDKFGMHYRLGIDAADLVTCNSAEMARVILMETGVTATVIPDPYEQPQHAPRIHDKLLWFGHRSNLNDLLPYLDTLKNVEIVTNVKDPDITYWSPESMDRAFDRAGLVIVPTGKSMAKSGNRAIESLRRGLFVVAGYLPAYADLGIYIGNIEQGVEWALTHQDEVVQRIKASQNYIAQEYCPERIGKLWLTALSA